MNIRQAILAAADHIEAHPKEFNYDSVQVPDAPHCGTPGCAIGWVSHFAKTTWELNSVLGYDCHFYADMDSLSGVNGWRNNAADCAATLRLYADKYHPAKPVALPNWQAMAAHQSIPESAVDEMVRA